MRIDGGNVTPPGGPFAEDPYAGGMSYARSQSRRVTRTGLTGVVPVLALVALMWVEEIVDTLPGTHFDRLGIQPRNPDGLLGIVFAPFLHAGFAHLMANTGAFVVLGALVAWTTRRFLPATLGIILFGGVGTWLLGQPYTVHIGASGVVYGYAAFLVAWGVLTRRVVSILVAVAVVVMYGGIVWGVLPGQAGVSWQGHLCGALAGVAMAWWLADRRSRRRRRFTSV